MYGALCAGVLAKRIKGPQVQVGARYGIYTCRALRAGRRNDQLTFRSMRRRGIDFIDCATAHRDYVKGCENNSAIYILP